MKELIQSLTSGFFWTLLFLFMTMFINKYRKKHFFSGTGFLLSYPLFALLQVVLIKSLDLIHLLNPRTVILFYFLATLLLAARLYPFKNQEIPFESRLENNPFSFLTGRMVGCSAGVILLLLIPISLLIPVHFRDDMSYRMPMVANYFQHQSLADWVTQCQRQITRAYTGELQLLNLALMSRSDAWMELPNLLALGVSLIAAFEIAKQVLVRKDLAFLCAVFILTAWQILLGPATAANDLPFMAMILCAFYWFISIGANTLPASTELKKCWGPVFFLGLSTALVISTKVSGVCIFAAIAVLLTFLVFTQKLPLPALIGFFISTSFFLLILMGDILWKNTMKGAVPWGIIPSEQKWLGFPSPLSVIHYYFFELGYKRFWDSQSTAYGESHFGFLYPVLFILGWIKGVYELFLSPKKRGALWSLAALSILSFFLTVVYKIPQAHDQRFMIWLVPAFGILGFSWLENWRPRFIVIAASLTSLLAMFSFFYLYQYSFAAYMIKESARYLSKNGQLPRYADLFHNGEIVLPSGRVFKSGGYDLFEKAAAPSDRILTIIGEMSVIYPAWGRRFTRTVDGVRDLEDAKIKIASGKYRWIIFDHRAKEPLKEAALTEARKSGYRAFAKSPARVIAERPPEKAKPAPSF